MPVALGHQTFVPYAHWQVPPHEEQSIGQPAASLPQAVGNQAGPLPVGPGEVPCQHLSNFAESGFGGHLLANQLPSSQHVPLSIAGCVQPGIVPVSGGCPSSTQHFAEPFAEPGHASSLIIGASQPVQAAANHDVVGLLPLNAQGASDNFVVSNQQPFNNNQHFALGGVMPEAFVHQPPSHGAGILPLNAQGDNFVVSNQQPSSNSQHFALGGVLPEAFVHQHPNHEVLGLLPLNAQGASDDSAVSNQHPFGSSQHFALGGVMPEAFAHQPPNHGAVGILPLNAQGASDNFVVSNQQPSSSSQHFALGGVMPEAFAHQPPSHGAVGILPLNAQGDNFVVSNQQPSSSSQHFALGGVMPEAFVHQHPNHDAVGLLPLNVQGASDDFVVSNQHPFGSSQHFALGGVMPEAFAHQPPNHGAFGILPLNAQGASDNFVVSNQQLASNSQHFALGGGMPEAFVHQHPNLPLNAQGASDDFVVSNQHPCGSSQHFAVGGVMPEAIVHQHPNHNAVSLLPLNVQGASDDFVVSNQHPLGSSQHVALGGVMPETISNQTLTGQSFAAEDNKFPLGFAQPNFDDPMSAHQPPPAFAVGPSYASVPSQTSATQFAEAQHEVHRYLADHAIMCIDQTPTTSQAMVPQGNPATVAVVAGASGNANPKPAEAFASIIRPLDESKLPFRPAAVKLSTGKVLSAVVQPQHASSPVFVQWEWGRVVDAVGMKSEKHGKWLKSNEVLHLAELHHAEISPFEISYKGAGLEDRGHHTMASRALLLLVLVVTSSKAFAPKVKENAMALAMELLQLGVKTLTCACSFVGVCYIKGTGYLNEEVSVLQTGLVKNMSNLIQKHPGALWAWNALISKGFCGQKIVSSATHPTIWDLILFLAWAKNSPSVKKVWQDVGNILWPKVLHACGQVLDSLADARSKAPMEEVPLILTRKGKNLRNVPWVNKLALLRKMRLVKHHRSTAASSHNDLVPKNSQVVMAEHFLSTSIYMKKLQSVYENCFHFSCHWDPSNYDIETMVSIVFSAQADAEKGGTASYLPIQNMKPVFRKEVDPEIQALGGMNKLTRISGFSEIRALSHSLNAIKMPLQKFKLPPNFLWQPLKPHQKRVLKNGAWWIVDPDGQEFLQIPSDFCIDTTPLLVSVSDQGSLNRSGLDYLVHKLCLTILVAFDPYHRSWNDIKLCLKSSKGDLFKTLLSFSLLWNTNYGPFNSREWFQKKQQKLRDFLEYGSPHQEPFLSFIPFICQERQIPEPTTPQEREHIFQSLSSMNNVRALGPVVKLMRWFSWFQSEQYFSGENWSMKFLMLETEKKSVNDSTNFVRSEENISVASGLTDKQELNQLKMKHGTWALAPLLVTTTSMFQKDLIALLVKPCWSAHSSMASKVLTPAQVASFTINKSQGDWVSEIFGLVLNGFHSPPVLKKLYPFQFVSEATQKVRVSIHFDFLVKLIAKRSMSLAAQFLRPPLRYAGLLCSDQVTSQNVQKKMQKEWEVLLGLEAKDSSGIFVKGLESLHFLSTSVARLAFMLNEQDLLSHTSNAAKVLKACVHHFGDTACVENTHQGAKDILTEARHNQRSRVHKFQACLNTKVMQSRKTNHIAVNELELTTTSVRGLPSFIPLTHPNSFAMQKSFQLMMQHKSGSHWWPSTTALSQFEEVAALEFLLQLEDTSCHQLSCLAGGPGSIIANDAKALVCMVLGASKSGFLAWLLEPVTGQGIDKAYACIKDKSALQFHHITKLDEWVGIPAEPALLNSHGSLIMVVSGDPTPLPFLRCQVGLDLTVAQCLEVLRAANVHLSGQPSKATVYSAFIDTFVPSDGREAALAKSKATFLQDEDNDDDRLSDYQEILGMIEEDTHNQGDPDIKGEKDKLKKKRRVLGKLPKVPGDDHTTLAVPKRRAFGRGKGKGKGGRKGRGRGEGVAKPKAKPKANSKKRKAAEMAPIADAPAADDGIDPGSIFCCSPTSPGDFIPELAEVEGAGMAVGTSELAAPSPSCSYEPETPFDMEEFLSGTVALEAADTKNSPNKDALGPDSQVIVPEDDLNALLEKNNTNKDALGPDSKVVVPEDDLNALLEKNSPNKDALGPDSKVVVPEDDLNALLEKNSHNKDALGPGSKVVVPEDDLNALLEKNSPNKDALGPDSKVVVPESDDLNALVEESTQVVEPTDCPESEASAPARASGSRGPNVFFSPTTLQSLGPPGGNIRLNGILAARVALCPGLGLEGHLFPVFGWYFGECLKAMLATLLQKTHFFTLVFIAGLKWANYQVLIGNVFPSSLLPKLTIIIVAMAIEGQVLGIFLFSEISYLVGMFLLQFWFQSWPLRQ